MHERGIQHLVWLLVSLLTRNTKAVIETIGLNLVDTPLLSGIDPAAPEGGPSLLSALKDAGPAFGRHAAPIVEMYKASGADLALQIGATANTRSNCETLHVAASGWTGAVSPNRADISDFCVASASPFGSYVAACLAAGEAYKLARFRDYSIQSAAMDAWTLRLASDGLRAVASVNPGAPRAKLDHVLAGVGAVGSALLLVLWSYRPVTGRIQAVDDDDLGVDETNLNRCVPFESTDIGQPKAKVAAERLANDHGLEIMPTAGRAECLVGPLTHLISAVDTASARQALQDRYPASAVQASTSGLRVEMLRVDPTAGSACLRCFNPPRQATPDGDVRARISDMEDATVAANAAAVGTSVAHVREWGQFGGCGQIGDALLDRLRPSNDDSAQFSVGFMSVLAGTLLAAQVIKDAIRRAGDPIDIAEGIPLAGDHARFVANLAELFGGVPGIRRYGRDSKCPACQGIRAEIWSTRWSG